MSTSPSAPGRAAPAAPARPRPLLVADEARPAPEDGRVPDRPAARRPRHADRVEARGTSRHGVGAKPRVVAREGRTISFADGSELGVDAVIWATGYRPDHSWIELPILGNPTDACATAAASPRSPASTSSASRGSTPAARHCLGFIEDDAAFIAAHIAASRHRQRRSCPQAVRGGLTMEHHDHDHTPRAARARTFPTETAGLAAGAGSATWSSATAKRRTTIAAVAKRIGGDTVRMVAYNGSVPGPALRVREGSEHRRRTYVNEGDLDERRCTGTVCGSRTATTGPTKRRHRSRSAAASPTIYVPRPGRLLVPPARPRGLRPGTRPVRQHPRRPG